MKYIIMCGGHYKKWETPRQLIMVNGEHLVGRTIRLLRLNWLQEELSLLKVKGPSSTDVSSLQMEKQSLVSTKTVNSR